MFPETTNHKISETNKISETKTEIGHSGASLISVFQEFSSSIGKTGGGAGRWAIILWGLDSFLMFPNFLSLKVVRQLVRQLIFTMFINNNNHTSFNLW